MPVGWLTMGTPEDLQELLRSGDHDRFEAEVDRRVESVGAVTIDILWEDEGALAHVVVAVPARNAEDVFEDLAGIFETEVKRLYNLQELKRRGPYSA
jgi:hypothetical protein